MVIVDELQDAVVGERAGGGAAWVLVVVA